MKFLACFLMVALPLQAGWFSRQSHHPRYQELKEGDIVFQDTGGQQGEAVRVATKSPYTHCGVVFENQGSLYVLEAVQPVRVTALAAWKKRYGGLNHLPKNEPVVAPSDLAGSDLLTEVSRRVKKG